MKKTILLTTLFFVLLVIVLSFIPFPKNKTAVLPPNGREGTENSPVNTSTTLPPSVTITKTEREGALPQGFPAIPLNGKEELRASYTLGYDKTKGAEQKVVDFLSEKSVKANASFYSAWAKENGWNIAHQSNIDGEARIILEKDAKSLTITIREDVRLAGKSAVNISY